MTTTVEKPAIHQSSALMFLRCQPQYAFRYIEGIKSPPRSALAFGSSFHKTNDLNYTQKIETHEDLPVSDLRDFWVDDFERRTEEVEWSDKEREQKVEVVRGKLIDTGVKCVSLYQEIVAPITQPLAVEQPFRITFDDDFPYDLAGTIDLITDWEAIDDNKTAAKSPNKTEAEQSLQLTLYALGYRATTQRIEKGLSLTHIVKSKSPKIIRQTTSRTNQQIQTALKLLGRLVKQIEDTKRSGAFLPTNPSNWWCSPEWCGYWNICEFGGKK